MQLEIDSDVKVVAEFMQRTVATARLVSVASALAELAPLLWGHYPRERVEPLQLIPLPINLARDSHTLADASG